MEVTDYERKSIEKLLGEPVLIGYDEKTSKIRTSLFFLSVVAIMYSYGGLKINSDSSFLGLRFDNLNDDLFRTSLLITIVYLLIHFLWNSFDSFVEWRLRLSGCKTMLRPITASYSDEDLDFTDNMRQSTLYNWWARQLPLLDTIAKKIDETKNKTREFQSYVQQMEDKPDPQDREVVTNIQNSIQKLRERNDTMHSVLSNLQRLYRSRRVIVSLERFDNWFKLFIGSQNIRWILIEFTLPTILGLGAILVLWLR